MLKWIYVYEKRGEKLQKSKQRINNKEINNNKEASREGRKKSEETIVSNSRWYDRKANMQTSDVPAVCLRR